MVKVVAEAHPDSTDGTGIWECVDVAAVSDVKKPVTLAEIKATKSLKDMVLVNNSRSCRKCAPPCSQVRASPPRSRADFPPP